MTALAAIGVCAIAAALVVLITRIAALPIEWALSMFGIGGIDAATATAEFLLGCGLCAIALDALLSPAGTLEVTTAAASSVAAGVAAAWLGSRVSPDDDPGRLQ